MPISTLIEKRSCLEYLKKEHPELTELYTLVDEMITVIAEMHLHTVTATFTTNATAACPVPQSTWIPNTNASATYIPAMPKDGRGQF